VTERPVLDGAVLDGAIRQVGYVVRDLDDAIAAWLGLGVGPWYTIREMAQTGSVYRGEPSEPTISIGFTNSGPMQIELIQQHGDTPSIYREFRDAGGDGYHQLAWWTPDFDALMARAEAAGWPVVFSGGTGGTRYAYFELDQRISTIVEVTELNEMTQGLATMLETATAEWDGVTDPVRSLL
jgi:catechol 2,3-dioxygenase-like lactoylglutathione lyase family enzyme